MDKLRTDVGINPSVNAVGVATSLYTREADYTQKGSPYCKGSCRIYATEGIKAGGCYPPLPNNKKRPLFHLRNRGRFLFTSV